MGKLSASSIPLDVQALDGEVVLRASDGPAGISLTPEAAAQTARRMEEAADLARSQQKSPPVEQGG